MSTETNTAVAPKRESLFSEKNSKLLKDKVRFANNRSEAERVQRYNDIKSSGIFGDADVVSMPKETAQQPPKIEEIQ